MDLNSWTGGESSQERAGSWAKALRRGARSGWLPSLGGSRSVGCLLEWLRCHPWLSIGPTGHFRGSPGVEGRILDLAQVDDGSCAAQRAEEFAASATVCGTPGTAMPVG